VDHRPAHGVRVPEQEAERDDPAGAGAHDRGRSQPELPEERRGVVRLLLDEVALQPGGRGLRELPRRS
jgi:hypothetical protein